MAMDKKSSKTQSPRLIHDKWFLLLCSLILVTIVFGLIVWLKQTYAQDRVLYVAQPTGDVLAAQTESEQILCDGKTYQNFSEVLFKITDSSSSLKIVRNCIFKNGSKSAIVINGGKHILIENNTFENLRSGVGGQDLTAVSLWGKYDTDDVVIRNNTFANIGSDGIQLGPSNHLIKNVTIEGNTFYVNTPKTGENAIDIKGVDGPVYVRNNIMYGFQPCPNDASQDCSGSDGNAIGIHDGPQISAKNVIVEGNEIFNSKHGIKVIEGPENIIIRHNNIHDNQKNGIFSNQTNNLKIYGNTFKNQEKHVRIEASVSNCKYAQNVFLGSGINTWGPCSQDNSIIENPNPSPIPTTQPSPSPIPTPTPSPSPTPTPKPSPTPSPSPTPTPRLTSTPTPTPRIFPTSPIPSPSPTSDAEIEHEFEDAQSLSGSMTIGTDKSASQNRYLYALKARDGSAKYSIAVPQTGDYYLWVRHNSKDSGSNSFDISFNGGSNYTVSTSRNGNAWSWQRVYLSGDQSGSRIHLQKGTHSVVVSAREADTKLDQFVLTTKKWLFR